jgi:hypothetical protein
MVVILYINNPFSCTTGRLFLRFRQWGKEALRQEGKAGSILNAPGFFKAWMEVVGHKEALEVEKGEKGRMTPGVGAEVSGVCLG